MEKRYIALSGPSFLVLIADGFGSVLFPSPRWMFVCSIQFLLVILGVMLYVTRHDHRRTDISRSNRLVGRCIIGFLAFTLILLSVVLFIPVQH